MGKLLNHTVLRIHADILEMLDREKVLVQTSSGWTPMPYADELYRRLQAFMREMPQHVSLFTSLYYLLSGVVACSKLSVVSPEDERARADSFTTLAKYVSISSVKEGNADAA